MCSVFCSYKEQFLASKNLQYKEAVIYFFVVRDKNLRRVPKTQSKVKRVQLLFSEQPVMRIVCNIANKEINAIPGPLLYCGVEKGIPCLSQSLPVTGGAVGESCTEASEGSKS